MDTKSRTATTAPDLGVSGVGTTIAWTVKPSLNVLSLVTIHPDGKIEYHEGYTPDAAAKAMWDAMGFRRALYEAAPDMLAALEELIRAAVAESDLTGNPSSRLIASLGAARSAHAKATGDTLTSVEPAKSESVS